MALTHADRHLFFGQTVSHLPKAANDSEPSTECGVRQAHEGFLIHGASVNRADLDPVVESVRAFGDVPGCPADVTLMLRAWARSWRTCGLAPLLPFLFRLKDRPLSLADRTPMEALFHLTGIPERSILKFGRQYGKSTVLCYQGIGRSIVKPYFNTLFLCPLYEQIRRFSQNYVKPALQTCMFRELIQERGSFGKGTENVLQRTLAHNGSSMFFSFAFNSADRVRGLPIDAMAFDEVQGVNSGVLFEIEETMSGSEFGWKQFSGTPMTMDNPLEGLWQKSSQAEWAIKCSCGFTNLMGFHYELMKCLGKAGLVCAKCGRPINTRVGYWHHIRPERRGTFVGRHGPQCILPLHCENPQKWALFLKKREVDEYKFMTECCAESWDSGLKLVTKRQLMDACTLPWANTWESFLQNAQTGVRHSLRVLAVDWSGGGADEVSLTAMVLLGLRADGSIDCLWLKTYPHNTNWADDAKRAIQLATAGGASMIVHDFGGAGVGRESTIVQCGYPSNQIIPVTYVFASAAKALMNYNPPDKVHVRHSYSLDKPRSLTFTCDLIKAGMLRFPQWATSEAQVSNFLALSEETMQTPRGSDVRLIQKVAGLPDDVAHAVNIGVCAIYYRAQNVLGVPWPNLAEKMQANKGISEIDPDLRAVDKVEAAGD